MVKTEPPITKWGPATSSEVEALGAAVARLFIPRGCVRQPPGMNPFRALWHALRLPEKLSWLSAICRPPPAVDCR